MIRSLCIKLITIVVMAAHSLFGCSFHHACDTCCAGGISACEAGCECQSCCCDCENDNSCSHHLKQKVSQNCCLHSQEIQVPCEEGKSPAKAPCQCKCEHSGCVFLPSLSRVGLIDGMSQPPAILGTTRQVGLQMCHTCRELQASLSSLHETRGCAMLQIWLI